MVHVKLVRLGLSPRGRGSQTGHIPQSVTAGPIPAWAGQPPVVPAAAASSRAYPRVGGAADRSGFSGDAVNGLSPRGRGSRRRGGCRCSEGGPIPAWAGQPPTSPTAAVLCKAYPRVGGAARMVHWNVWTASGLSPRGRGSRQRRQPSLGPWGPIPAWAGQPAVARDARRKTGAYPRVGGAAVGAPEKARVEAGLSPRGRGSPSLAGWTVPRPGPIPAWAGQPPPAGGRCPWVPAYPRVGGAAWYMVVYGWHHPGLSPRGRGSPMRWHR